MEKRQRKIIIVTVGQGMTKKKSNMVAKKIKEKVKENTNDKIYAQYNTAEKQENRVLQD